MTIYDIYITGFTVGTAVSAIFCAITLLVTIDKFTSKTWHMDILWWLVMCAIFFFLTLFSWVYVGLVAWALAKTLWMAWKYVKAIRKEKEEMQKVYERLQTDKNN